jgi:hypothetical protein
MKTTFRRTIALALGSVALAVGLGVPTAAPAAAASCSEVTAVGGAIPHVAMVQDSSGKYWQQVVFDGVYAKTSASGCSSSSSWRYLALMSYSGGIIGGEASLLGNARYPSTTVSFPSRQTYFWVPPGDGTVTFEVQAQSKDYFGNWRTQTTATWRVKVPNTAFDSTTGQGMGPNGCYAPNEPKYAVAKWC